MDPAQAYMQEAMARARAALSCTGVNSAVRPAYKDSTVFITGGAGFLGKHLLEKLFRTCLIKKAFLLLRPKKKKTIVERLNAITEDSVFDGLRQERPDFTSRLVVIEGDVSQLRLGISDDDWKTLSDEIDFIFHAAATINFEEHIKVATLTNVRGTREMVTLARECQNLRAVIHISTAFSQATNDNVNQAVFEKFYASPISPELLIDMAENLDDNLLGNITPQLLKHWPNSYTYTKAVAEDLIRTAAEDLPIRVIRPAIVINSYREPVPGWLDFSSMYGPSGLVLGGGLGIMHVLRADKNAKIDLVPVDYVTNASIAAGWAATLTKEARIYTITSTRHGVNWDQKQKYFFEDLSAKYHTSKAMWYIFMTTTKNSLLFHFLAWLWHYIPAYILDTLCWLVGKPTLFIKLFTKAAKLQRVLSFFTVNDWEFSDINLVDLYNQMTDDDKIMFDCDIGNVDWREHITLWTLSVRKYIINDKLEDTEYGVKKQKWLKFVHYIVTPIYFYLLFNIICFICSMFYYIIYTFSV